VKEEIFISSMLIILLFNGFVIMVNPEIPNVLDMDLTSILVTGLAVAIASGVTVFGSGLSDSATSIIFGVILMFNVLYKIEVYGFTLGLGLVNTMSDVFIDNDVLGIGWYVTNLIGFVAFVTCMMMIIGVGD